MPQIPQRALYLTFDQVAVVVTPNHTVGVQWNAPSEDTALAAGLIPAVELTPEEARMIAQMLLSKADEAESQARRS